MRPAVEHGGLLFLAVLLGGVVLFNIPLSSWPDLFLPLFWGLVGIRTLAEGAAGPERRWVPRGWSLLAAGVILFLGFSGRDWIESFSSVAAGNAGRWMLRIQIFLLGCAVPLMAWIHFRSVGKRSGSLLLGWLMAFLFFAYLPLNYTATPALPHLSLVRFPEENPVLYSGAYAYWLGDRGIEVWGLVTLLEFIVVMKFWRRRPFRSLDLREWESSLPFAVGLLAVPFAGMRFVSGYFFRFFGNARNLEILLPYFLLPALVISLALGLWLSRKALPRDTNGNPRKRDTALLLLASFFLLVPYIDVFSLHQYPTLAVVKVLVIGSFCFIACSVDFLTARRSTLDGEAAVVEREERAGLREFVRAFRTPSLATPLRSRRLPAWLLPFLVWGALLAVSAVVFPILLRRNWFSASLNRLLIEPGSFGSKGLGYAVRLRTFELFCAVVLACCVVLCSLLLIPWRMAGRFRRSWNTARIRDAWMANIPPWRIFWVAILAPARTLLVVVLTSIVFLGGCAVALFLWVVSGPSGIEGWSSSGGMAGTMVGILCVLCVMLTGLGIVLLVIGFSRHKKFRGPGAYVLAVMIQLFFWIGTAVLLGNTFLEDGAFCPILAAFALWFLILGRWAFGGVAGAVQNMAGE